jgi:hypothetical protein
MNRYNISNHHSGADLGDWEAESEQDALDKMAIEAGYKDYADCCARVGESNDLVVTLIETKLPANTSAILARIATRNEAGTHFTQVFSADELAPLEDQGLIEITRQIHAASGIKYSQEDWTVDLTVAGLEYLDANPTYPRINKIGEAAIRNFLIENHREFSTRAPTASELQAFVEKAEQSAENGNGAAIELRHWEVVLGGYHEFWVPAAGLGFEGESAVPAAGGGT